MKNALVCLGLLFAASTCFASNVTTTKVDVQETARCKAQDELINSMKKSTTVTNEMEPAVLIGFSFACPEFSESAGEHLPECIQIVEQIYEINCGPRRAAL